MDRTVIHCCVFTSFCRSRSQPHNRNGEESDGEQTKERAATFYEISLSYCHEHGSRNRKEKKKKKKKEKKKKKKKKAGDVGGGQRGGSQQRKWD